MSQFIWSNKTPRIKKVYLKRPKSTGGMGLPNFQFYYWLCNIRTLSFTLQDPLVVWSETENQTCTPSSWPGLIFSAIPSPPSLRIVNSVASHSFKIWSQIRKHFKWRACSIHVLLMANHSFPPSLSDTISHLV